MAFQALLRYDKGEHFINLPEAGNKAALLRQISVDISASVDYEADALMTSHHFSPEKLRVVKGKLEVVLEAISKGWGQTKPELVARYAVILDHQNAPFRLHAFVKPDGRLADHYSLEWDINTEGDLSFF